MERGDYFTKTTLYLPDEQDEFNEGDHVRIKTEDGSIFNGEIYIITDVAIMLAIDISPDEKITIGYGEIEQIEKIV